MMLNMQKTVLFLLVIGIIIQCAEPTVDGTLIADNGRSDYSIIIPQNPTQAERDAAEYLKNNLQNIAKVSLAVLTDATPVSDHEIVLGASNRVEGMDIPVDQVGPEGYAIKTVGKKLVMYSPKEGHGVEHAVTDLLGSFGLNRFIPNMTVYRIDSFLTLPIVDVLFNPPFVWRSLDHIGANQEEFALWHKLNNTNADRMRWGTWDHDMVEWINPESNPEFFSGGQLKANAFCLTDDYFYNTMATKLADRIRIKGSADYWVISPINNGNYCQCTNCQQVNAQEGSEAGALIQFINKLAAAFPSKTLATMVQGEALVPATTSPANNVMIVINTDQISRSTSIAEDEYNAAFRENLDGWLAQTNQIMVYEHLVQPGNPVSPFPVLHSLAENLKYYADKGIQRIHVQGTQQEGASLAELKTYVASKLLWDPTIELDYLISSFCQDFYGTAGDYITRYNTLLQEQAAKYGSRMTIYGNPTIPMKTHLRQELMDQYNYFFNQAEEVIKADPEIRDRVKLARLPLVYASLEHARVNGTDKRGLFLNINGRWMAVPGMQTLATDFANECDRLGVRFLDDIAITPQQYAQNILEVTAQPVKSHLAIKQNIALRRPAAQEYSLGNANILVDGLYGDNHHRYGWIGYKEFDLESTITFAQVKDIREIQIRFKHDPANRIYGPKSVNIQMSSDGTEFKGIGNNTVPSKNDNGVQTFTFAINQKGVKALKVNGMNIQTIPNGQVGAGEAAWLFADEILVE